MDPITVVHEALRRTWAELGQDHHEAYIDETEVEILVKHLLELGAQL